MVLCVTCAYAVGITLGMCLIALSMPVHHIELRAIFFMREALGYDTRHLLEAPSTPESAGYRRIIALCGEFR